MRPLVVARVGCPGAGGAAYQVQVDFEIRPTWSASGWRVDRPTLFASDAASIPWDLVPAGFRFLAGWDILAPLSGRLAAETGTAEDRARAIPLLDLRVPTYDPRLIFARGDLAGETLHRYQELSACCDASLALTIAVAEAKPLFLALPRTWLAARRDR